MLLDGAVRSSDRLQMMEGSVVLVRPGLEVDVDEIPWQPQILIHHEYVEDDVPGQISTQKDRQD